MGESERDRTVRMSGSSAAEAGDRAGNAAKRPGTGSFHRRARQQPCSDQTDGTVLLSQSTASAPSGLWPTIPTRCLVPIGEAGDGDYRLLNVIDEGGMGTVYLAQQVGLDRLVAIKMLHEHATKETGTLEAFLQEAYVTSYLDHPHIIHVHEIGDAGKGRPFYVMNRVVGRSWDQVIRSRSRDENISILEAVCQAVAFAHEHGIVHRDLKPSNVMLGDFGAVYLADWGLAAAVNPEAPGRRIGVHNAIAGSVPYMAPEVASGRFTEVGRPADVYMLGAILFEIAVGKAPHYFRTIEEALQGARENAFISHDADDDLVAIALQAMATRPDDRHASVGHFLQSLSGYRGQQESRHLTQRAEEEMTTALDLADYGRFSRSCFAFEEALVSWPHNKAAQRGLDVAQQAFANCALDRGDLELASSLISLGDVRHEDLRQRLGQLRDLRKARQQALERLQAIEDEQMRQQNRNWECIIDDDFQDGVLPDHWNCIDGQWSIVGGELRRWGSESMLTLLDKPLAGDLRIEISCYQVGQYLNDVTVFFAAVPAGKRGEGYNTGYEIKYGGYDNSMNLLIRNGRRLWVQGDRPWRSGCLVELQIQRIDNRLTMFANGEQIFDLEDPDPLVGPGRTLCGIFGWCSETRFKKIRISRLGRPLVEDELTIAERQLNMGNYQTAIDLYAEVADSDDDGSRVRRAGAALERTKQMQSLHDQYSQASLQLRRLCPGGRIDLLSDGFAVNLDDCAVENLQALQGTPVSWLSARRAGLESLDGIQDAPLESLIASISEVRDLSAAKDLPIHTMHLHSSRVSDLRALAGMPLRYLDIRDTEVSDIGGLDLRELSHCFLSRGVTDFSSLKELSITALSLVVGAEFNDAILPSLQLSNLYIYGVDAWTFNCQQILTQPINVLQVKRCDVVHADALAEMDLQDVTLQESSFSDLSLLSLGRLVNLNVWDSPVKDLSPLQDSCLSQLNIGRSKVTKLEALRGTPVEYLNIDATALQDWRDLEGIHCLSGFSALGTQPDSLEPLAVSRLQHVVLDWEGLSTDLTRPFFAEIERHPDWPLHRLCRLVHYYLQGRWDALRAEAESCQGRRFLALPIAKSLADARQLAKRAGAQLAVPRNRAMMQALQLDVRARCWLGLSFKQSRVVSDTGDFVNGELFDELDTLTGPDCGVVAFAGRWRIMKSRSLNYVGLEWED